MFFQKTYPVGIDISDYSIEVLQLNKKREVLAYGRVILEKGIVEDGKVLDKAKLAQSIVEVLENTKPHPLRAKSYKLKAIVSLPESKVFIHSFQVPSSAATQDRILFEASNIIPYDLSELYYDYELVRRESPQAKNIEGETANSLASVLFVAVPKKIVDAYREVAKIGGIELVAIDIESASLARSLLFSEEEASWLHQLKEEGRQGRGLRAGGFMIIDIGARTTNMSIFDAKGMLRMSTTVPVAGEKFTSDIANKLHVGIQEAEELKRSFGLDVARQDNRVAAIVQASFQPVLVELRSAIAYGEEKLGISMGKIILAGGSSLLPKIEEYLASNIEKEIRLGNPLERIRGGRIFSRRESPIFFADVIGLALRAITKNPADEGFNLLPSDENVFQEQKQKKAPHSVIRTQHAEGKVEEVKRTRKAQDKKRKAFVLYVPFVFRSRFLFFALSGVGLFIFGFGAYKIFMPRTYEVVIPPSSSGETEEGIPPQEGMSSGVPQEQGKGVPNASKEGGVSSGGENGAPKKEEIFVIIDATPTGWLNVREGPGTSFAQVTRIYPGETHPVLEESAGWYKIKLKDEKVGWIYGIYAKISNQ